MESKVNLLLLKVALENLRCMCQEVQRAIERARVSLSSAKQETKKLVDAIDEAQILLSDEVIRTSGRETREALRKVVERGLKLGLGGALGELISRLHPSQPPATEGTDLPKTSESTPSERAE
ncbi:MAG: hypothetical protein DRJ03_07235 [Chloroflexi bacterium]|nr:MAG: hypothetical protein DRJ03_07235 [Chloroflexota bacterium]